MLTINPKEVTIPVLHAYLQGAVAPRPIAFASTMDKNGHVNLSPFSFFNVFGTNPPTLIFSPNRRVRDGSSKDTLENVLEHDEVVINMVDYAMVEQNFAQSGSIVATIEALRGDGKTLELLDLEKPTAFEKLIAENELLDPEHADGFLEPLSERGLRKRWREGRRRISERLKRCNAR